MNRKDIRAELLEIRDRCDRVLAHLDDRGERQEASSPWMTAAEYAAYQSVSTATVLRWRRAGMPATGRGKLIRIHKEQADQWRTSNPVSSSVKTAAGF